MKQPWIKAIDFLSFDHLVMDGVAPKYRACAKTLLHPNKRSPERLFGQRHSLPRQHPDLILSIRRSSLVADPSNHREPTEIIPMAPPELAPLEECDVDFIEVEKCNKEIEEAGAGVWLPTNSPDFCYLPSVDKYTLWKEARGLVEVNHVGILKINSQGGYYTSRNKTQLLIPVKFSSDAHLFVVKSGSDSSTGPIQEIEAGKAFIIKPEMRVWLSECIIYWVA
ncbi:hypothetical protein E6O75_ATG08365 [Venturia nashicola]|uniref:Uncharacterized protein n=1 Tax=Venturia nashicola TaxID=86259 RepID=A0A4Z1NV00_9PEZI|nr:hypothetical protein E6O75_ATG08365 [Venturia nashicola]